MRRLAAEAVSTVSTRLPIASPPPFFDSGYLDGFRRARMTFLHQRVSRGEVR